MVELALIAPHLTRALAIVSMLVTDELVERGEAERTA